MAAISNRTLVQELKFGERLGCTHLVDLFQARFIEQGVSLFNLSKEDAEELVSDVLVAAVKSIHSFQFKRGDGDFTVWMITIFRNRVRDFIRSQARSDGFLERFCGDGVSYNAASSRVEREVAKTILAQYREEIRQADGECDARIAAKLMSIADTLERLKPWERVLLRCRALDISYEDIAAYTDKSVNQLKVYHARVRRRFIKLLSEHYPELQNHEERNNRKTHSTRLA